MCGEELSFPGFTLYGFPSSNVFNIPAYESPYDLEKEEFYLRMSTKDFITNCLEPGVEFEVNVKYAKFGFSIMSFNHDMTGWTKVNLNYTGMAYV